MANVGKVVAQLSSANNENTIALANANFNFSLVRVDSPKEYAGLGAALTAARREDAETGTAHMTARKLGALFEDAIEPAPELFKAYGRRVSMISTSRLANHRGPHGHGLFERHVGPDGTTIWAAATSGKTALAVNLLASLLARLWSGPEATSIWVELVAERKRHIEKTCDGSEPSHLAPMHAAMQPITRKELAEWDASARAWLRTADEVKKREQTRCRLIINNLNISVDNNVDVYGSVIRAWKTAMQMMERLIKGMPQRVQNGAILLAMSAWHLYPDMVVLGSEEKLVRQQDSLITEGGYLTVGLESANPHDGNEGVYWSLSLAHLRFYGDPVLAHRYVGNDASRVTFRSFTLLALGSFLRTWCKQVNGLVAGAGLVKALWEHISQGPHPHAGKFQQDSKASCAFERVTCTTSWLAILANAAEDLLDPQDPDREEKQLLLQAGARHGSLFFGNEPTKTRAFGLYDASLWLRWSEDIEQCIALLRSVAKRRKWHDKVLIIRYKNGISGDFDLATVSPILKGSRIWGEGGTKHPVKSHTRWISTPALIVNSSVHCSCAKGGCTSNKCSCRRNGLSCNSKCHRKGPIMVCENKSEIDMEKASEAAKLEALSEECIWIDRKHTRINGDDESFSWYNAPTMFAAPGATDYSEDLELSMNDSMETTNAEELDMEISEEPVTPPLSSVMDIEQDFLEFDLWSNHKTTTMHRLIGDANIAAIYAIDHTETTQQQAQVQDFQIEELTEMLRAMRVPSKKLIEYIGISWPSTLKRFYLRSLKAFATAAHIYKLLPNATVELKAISRSIGSQQWVPETSGGGSTQDNLGAGTRVHGGAFDAFNLDRAQTLACLAMFETGTMDIRPSVLKNLLAMATGNSIYVPASLVCDPHEAPQQHELARIVGNIGRPGVAMLYTPEHLRIREPSVGNWRVVQHKDFDGESKNSFSSTSLHLSFTGYDLPVDDVTTKGAQDIEAYFVESVISVHEHGKWVADIDILATLQDPLFRRLPSTPCSHHSRGAVLPFQTTAIDNWDEYLDPPENACVFRAQNNKLARLAAAAVSVQKKKHTLVAKDTICFQCCTAILGRSWTRNGFSDVNLIL